jgi:hypothetical protein
VKFDTAFSTPTPQSTTGPFLAIPIGGGRTINTTAPLPVNDNGTVTFSVSDVFAERFIIVVFRSANVLRRIDLMTMREVSIEVVDLRDSESGSFALSSQLGFLRFETLFRDSCGSSFFLRLNFDAPVPFAKREAASGVCGSEVRFDAKNGKAVSWFSATTGEESSSCSSIKPKSSVAVAGADALDITKFIQECSHSSTTVFNSAILFLVAVLVL